jgi:hypothetical protein
MVAQITKKTLSFLEQIITSSHVLFKDCVSDMGVEITKLGNPSRETAENKDTVKPISGS